MKYRVQFLVSATRLPDVVAAAFGGKLDYDPELKLWPASQPTPQESGYAHTRKMIDENLYKKVATPKRRAAVPGKRQEVVEAALRTGPKRWGDLRTALAAGGLSESSLNSLISQWQKQGKIVRDGRFWSLNDGPTQTAHAG
jgi:hypothetical protein